MQGQTISINSQVIKNLMPIH